MSENPAVNGDMVEVLVNGSPLSMPAGSTVAAALLTVDAPCRISTSGERRTALCGMGICFECRALIDGVPHQRTCRIICRDGMRVETQS